MLLELFIDLQYPGSSDKLAVLLTPVAHKLPAVIQRHRSSHLCISIQEHVYHHDHDQTTANLGHHHNELIPKTIIMTMTAWS
eukprot:4370806-Lingulodinium_polyedra.AAC.1